MDPTDWLPFYPDLLPRRRGPLGSALASQPPYNTGIFPVPDILASLTFLPSFPDRVPRIRTTCEQTTVTSAAIGIAMNAPIAWLPDYPPFVPHRRLPTAGFPFEASSPPGTLVIVAQSMAWQPRWRDPAPRRAQFPSGGIWTVEPALLSVPCLDLGLQAVAATGFLDEVVTSPALIGEGLGTPALINEDLC